MKTVRIIKIEEENAFENSVKRFMNQYNFSEGKDLFTVFGKIIRDKKLVKSKNLKEALKKEDSVENLRDEMRQEIEKLPPAEKIRLFHEMLCLLHECWVSSVLPNEPVYVGEMEHLFLPLEMLGKNDLSVYYRNSSVIKNLFPPKTIRIDRLSELSASAVEEMVAEYQVDNIEGIIKVIQKKNSGRMPEKRESLRIMQRMPYAEYVAGQLWESNPAWNNAIRELRIQNIEKEIRQCSGRITSEMKEVQRLLQSLLEEETVIEHRLYGKGILKEIKQDSVEVQFAAGKKSILISFIESGNLVKIQDDKMNDLKNYVALRDYIDESEPDLKQLRQYVASIKKKQTKG